MMLQPNFSPFPELKTARLVMRCMESSDAADLFAMRSNDQVMRYLDRAPTQNIEEAQQLIQRILSDIAENKGVTWVLCLPETRKLIGTMGFWKITAEHFRAEIGYMMFPEWQGRGLASEALQAALNYGFSTMGLHSVEANVNPNNAASIRLLERLGFVREAYFRENYFYNGQFLDSAIYSLIHNE